MEILIIIALNLITYFRILKNDVIVDDIHWYRHLRENPGSFHNIPSFIGFIRHRLYGGGIWTPKKDDSKELQSLKIQVDNAVVIALHTLGCVLIYIALGSNTISFWAAVLYSVNPINNQSSIWKNGRRFAVNTILVMSMLIFAPWGMIFYFMTPLFQINAVFAPFLLAHKYPLFLLIIPLGAALTWKEMTLKIFKRNRNIQDLDRKNFTPKRIIIIVKNFGHYFFKMIAPGLCNFQYPTLHYWGRTEKGNQDAYSFNLDFYKGAIACSICVVGCFILPTPYSNYLAFMVLATLQWCSIVPVTGDLADRYVTLPNVFMMLFVSYIVNTYAGAYAVPILAGVAVYYTMSLLTTMRMYKDFFGYWEYNRYFFPTVPMFHEAEYYLEKGQHDKALTLALDGLRHCPTDYNLLSVAARACNQFRDLPLALRFAERAKENYFLYQDKTKGGPKFMEQFIADLRSVISKMQPASTPVSRQVRRAEERKAKK